MSAVAGKIIELHRQGLSVSAIAAAVERSTRTVRDELRKAGIPTPRRAVLWRAIIDRALALRAEGLPLHAIACSLGVSPSTVGHALRRAGIGPLRKTAPPEIVERVLLLHGRGMGTAAIGAELGITKNAVIGLIHRHSPEILAKIERKRAAQKHRLPAFPPPGGCLWITGDPRDAEHSFCGATALPGKSYCHEHRNIAVLKIRGAADAAV